MEQTVNDVARVLFHC